MKWLAEFISIMPQTDIQGQRLTAMNRHWQSISGNESIMSFTIVAVSVIGFFLVLKFVSYIIQSRSRDRRAEMRKRNRNIK